MSAIIPIPKIELSIRPATMDDLAFLDSLQKQHNKQLGYFPTKQFEGYIAMGGVLVAEASGKAVGYCISRDRYLKRDELGVIYQLCVAPGAQRGLIGASLVKEVFARSAYGCRLYCCWCAKDLEANHFWEAMGFVPIAFRAGGKQKKDPSTGLRAGRVHIFWQKRIVENDTETKWWYPSKTDQGAIREDRLVFPIPPGVSWRDVEAVAVPGGENPKLEDRSSNQIGSAKREMLQSPAIAKAVGIGFLQFVPPEPVEKPKRERPKRVKTKNDPKHIAAARELRDRYLEELNSGRLSLTGEGKYEVSRPALDAPVRDATKPVALLSAA
jgi:N-acetylglutamate synthase-like GNAT family acetyltransferase